MSDVLTITNEQLVALMREEVARVLVEERPLIRAQIIEEMKFVTEETGVKLLEIEGKQPLRTFRRLMAVHRVHFVKLGGVVRWKLRGENSIEKVLERHETTAKPKRFAVVKRRLESSKHQDPNSSEAPSSKAEHQEAA